MKPLPFKIPKTEKESFKVQDDRLNHLFDRLHSHPEIQLTYVIESSGTRFIGHNVDNFYPDQIYIIGPDIAHMFKNHQEYYSKNNTQRAHCLSIFFREESFGNMFNLVPEVAAIKNFIRMSALGIKINSRYARGLKKDFIKMKKLTGFDRFQHFLELLQRLANSPGLELLSQSNLEQQSNEEDGLRLNKIITYTTQNYARKMSLAEVAKEANLSTSSFCRYFKLHTRKSFISFLNEFRIGIACRELLNKEKNISEICYQTGFNNISNFNRQFKAVTGFTPTQYVKKGW